MSKQVDANDLVNGLLETVAQQAKEIALLRVQLSFALADEAPEESDD
jgi:hypothetical protein